MLHASKIAETLIPVTQFNRGQTSKIFEKLNKNPSLIILKNNKPTAFILSPKEYERLSEMEENYYLLQEAVERLSKSKKTISHKKLLAELGITQEEIDSTEDVEIE